MPVKAPNYLKCKKCSTGRKIMRHTPHEEVVERRADGAVVGQKCLYCGDVIDGERFAKAKPEAPKPVASASRRNRDG